MRLIEKECPNCGASVEFNENDKTCKCEYCKRSFTIERDKEDNKKIDPRKIKLNEMKAPMKAIAGSIALTWFAMYVTGFIMFIAIVIFFIFIFLQIISM